MKLSPIASKPQLVYYFIFIKICLRAVFTLKFEFALDQIGSKVEETREKIMHEVHSTDDILNSMSR